MNPPPTAQQHRAIHTRGDILVMAGAGAGKTSTLVARILHRALDSTPPIPLDRFLVVTFNEAAAAEMRHRLGLALDARLLQQPDNSWIAEQRALLDTAAVSTLHAFCLRLVREHFHELDLDPQFTVQDEIQTRIQRNAALRDVLRSHLDGSAHNATRIRPFLARHARDSTEAVEALIVKVHEYARSLPEPATWIASQRIAYQQSEPELWRSQAASGIREWAAGWLDHARQCASRDPANIPARECARALETLAASPSASTAASQLEILRLAADTSRFEKEKRKASAWLKPLRKCLDEATVLRDLLAPSRPGQPAALDQDWTWVQSDTVALLELVAEFDRTFAAARRAAAAVDFSDLEQLSLQLLWDPIHARPTPLARQWQDAIDLVFVDEYQDINGAQDRILQCVSRTGSAANRFYVGDIKQSIYRFRRADPRIFQEYARLWRSGNDRAVAPLTENFRSHEVILQFVNRVFQRIMRPDLGGVAYDAEAELQLGAAEARTRFREKPDGRIEFHLHVTGAHRAPEDSDSIDQPPSVSDAAPEPDDTAPDLDAEESQAGLIAHRLLSLRSEGCTLWDASLREYRSLRWRDVVVLHPAPRSIAERWARAFAVRGIPLDARRGGFYEALEVSDLVHLVRLLDNPRQDLPLLAVLRSPLVGMTVSELAALRVASPRHSIWEALHALARTPGTALGESELRSATASARAKAAAFLEAHERWRRLAIQGSLAACLETVLAETCYEAWLLSQERADAKRANLRRLLALSRQFDAFQRHGLFRFIQFIEAQADAADRVESAPAAVGDSVRLISMHQSKGLEFPVVVVAGLGHQFNTEDLNGDWILDAEYGVCPPVIPPGRTRGYPSLPRWLGGLRQRRELIGEQTRLLYVACTRPVERLLLVGSTREARLQTWASSEEPVPTRQLLEARCPLDWLGPLIPALAGTPDVFARESGQSGSFAWRLWRQIPTPPPPEIDRLESAAPIDDHTSPQPEADPHALRRVRRDASSESQLSFDLDPPRPSSNTAPPAFQPIAHLRQRLEWRYPWLDATHETAKAAVTALRRQWLANEETAPVSPDAVPARSRVIPVDNAPSSESAVDRGLAHHLFNERVDLSLTASRESLVAELHRLETQGWLTPTAAANLDLDGLAAFWLSPLAETLRAEPVAVHRELPFTARLRLDEARLLGRSSPIQGFAEDDYQVVQGVVDLAFIRPEEIWIVDFKTDRVSRDTSAARAAEYAPQIRIYAHALAGIYRRPVTRRWLYFIATRELVTVD